MKEPRNRFLLEWKEKSDAIEAAMNVTISYHYIIIIIIIYLLNFVYTVYIQATAALCILALATDVFATLLTGNKLL